MLNWAVAEPSRGQYDWAPSDALVSLASVNDVELLPVVIYAPQWARQHPDQGASVPKNPADYARFMTALIGRYGPNGSFWAEHPELPQAADPHLADLERAASALPVRRQRDEEDYAKAYGQLLRPAYKAVKKADPGAKVVLAGLANRSYAYLNALYRRGKIRGSFDIAALHPYTAKPDGVVELTRRFRE